MKSNFKSNIRKKAAIAGLAGAFLLNSAVPAYAGKVADAWDSIKYSIQDHPYRWAIGAAAVVLGGVYVYNEDQRKKEEDRRKAEEQARYTADTDADGMVDYLEMQYFGNLSQSANADYDNDGYTNAQEINNGSDPADAESMPGSDWHDLSVSSIKKKACSVKPSRLENAVTVNAVSREIGFAVPVRNFYIYGTKSLTNSDFKINLAYKFK